MKTEDLDIRGIVETQRRFFHQGETRDCSFRLDTLKRLKNVLVSHETDILTALENDLGKAPFEAFAAEYMQVMEELNYMIRNLRRLMRPKRARTPLTAFPSKSFIYSEPLGVTLVISPWNYPFLLTMVPFIGSIAGGNCTVIKPSDYSRHTAELISRIVDETCEREYAAVVLGGREENRALLNNKFDYIFFTGSTAVGKLVMQSAAEFLTPVTLELGGKSPCIVDKTADVKNAAEKIAWGKFLNAGQTCVAPDYVLVHHDVSEELVSAIEESIGAFYGKEPCRNREYPKIINEKHFNRLLDLIRASGYEDFDGYCDDDLKINPVVLRNAGWDDEVMKDEIFGPVLPVIEYSDMDDVIAEVKSRPKPLALYLFSADKNSQDYIIEQLQFGGGCINDTVMHLSSVKLPFGGIGESGMGSYHGESSFNTFTHKKSILKSRPSAGAKIRYAPYKDRIRLLRKLVR